MIIQITLPTLAEMGHAAGWVAITFWLAIAFIIMRACMNSSHESRIEERSAWARRMNGFAKGPVE